MTFEEKLKSKIEREAKIYVKPLALSQYLKQRCRVSFSDCGHLLASLLVKTHKDLQQIKEVTGSSTLQYKIADDLLNRLEQFTEE